MTRITQIFADKFHKKLCDFASLQLCVHKIKKSAQIRVTKYPRHLRSKKSIT